MVTISVAVFLAGALVIGGAQSMPGLDLTASPVMVETPVILADGAPLFVQKYEVTVAECEYMAAEVLPPAPAPAPIFTDPDLTWASAYILAPQTKRTLRPQGTFATTSQGIVDLDDSVWEWTQNCYAGVADGQTDRHRYSELLLVVNMWPSCRF